MKQANTVVGLSVELMAHGVRGGQRLALPAMAARGCGRKSSGRTARGEPRRRVRTCAARPLWRPAHFSDIDFERCQHYSELWEARGREGGRGVTRRAEREAGGRTEDRPPHVRGGAQSRALGSTGEITPVGIPPRGPGLFLGRNLSARTGFLPDPWAGESEETALVFAGFLPCVSGYDVASWPATGCAWKSPHSDSGLCPPCDAGEAW